MISADRGTPVRFELGADVKALKRLIGPDRATDDKQRGRPTRPAQARHGSSARAAPADNGHRCANGRRAVERSKRDGDGAFGEVSSCELDMLPRRFG
jgi:hypothetical protein